MNELCKKYNFNYFRLLRWIKKGYVKAKKEKVEKVIRSTKWLIDEESFLSIPAFIRKSRKRYGSNK
ncbi:MAG: hypothetical protein N2505_07110 [Endomicrobia bacterium]|nr:hypothetical protein [Endomicrobiia bacterium]